MRNAVSAMFVASVLAVGAAAQGQQPAAQEQKGAAQAQKPEAAQPAKVTISGCIQTAPPPAAAAADVPPAAAAASKFELANAKIVSGGPVGTTGATTATRYRLEAEEKTISPHMNHQVELTGMVIGPSTPPAAGSAAAAPLLKVESLKMVAAKCS